MADIKYGVTPEGFVRMRLPEILNGMYDRLEAKLGQPVSRKPNSMLGVLLGIVAYESDKQWQLAEADYYARSPVSADEGSIDNTLAYTNVIRRQAEHTYLYLVCYGRNGMILPANCQAKSSDGEKYDIDGMATISLDNCVSVTLNAVAVEGKRYTVVLDDELRLDYTAKGSDTQNHIYLALIEQVTGDGWSASVKDGNLVLQRKDRRYGGIAVPSETLTVVEVGSPIKFLAQNTGSINPELNTITTINTNYDGWWSVNNESGAYVGRDAETVTEVRQRYASAVYRNSMTMKESIKAAILELTDVKNCTVYENRSDVVVDGMKPHSVEVIVHGGDDIEIANTIINRLSAGIDTNGSVEMTVTDSEGTEEVVKFNRPKEIPIYVMVKIHEYKEEVLPGDLVNIVKNIVMEEGGDFGMGKDVIAQRFLGPIYRATQGIGYIELTISKDGRSYSDKSIAIDRGEVSTYSADRITVALELRA